MLVDHDHICWKSWKLIALFVAQWSPTYSYGNAEKFWGENVRSTPTSIMSGWIESSSTESHVNLGGGVAAGCLFTFVIALRGNLCDCTAFLSVICCKGNQLSLWRMPDSWVSELQSFWSNWRSLAKVIKSAESHCMQNSKQYENKHLLASGCL